MATPPSEPAEPSPPSIFLVARRPVARLQARLRRLESVVASVLARVEGWVRPLRAAPGLSWPFPLNPARSRGAKAASEADGRRRPWTPCRTIPPVPAEGARTSCPWEGATGAGRGARPGPDAPWPVASGRTEAEGPCRGGPTLPTPAGRAGGFPLAPLDPPRPRGRKSVPLAHVKNRSLPYQWNHWRRFNGKLTRVGKEGVELPLNHHPQLPTHCLKNKRWSENQKRSRVINEKERTNRKTKLTRNLNIVSSSFKRNVFDPFEKNQ